MYKIAFSELADEDIKRWKKSGQKIIMNRISKLLIDIQAHPLTGIGKPEALCYDLSGKYSRRINDEHRIIYSINNKDEIVTILSLYGHY